MTQNKKAVVVDFDGTFVKVNSFELFIKYLLFFSFLHVQFRLFTFLSFEILKRKLRLESHGEMKMHILWHLKNNETYNVLPAFLTRLSSYINKNVLAIVEERKQKGCVIILSSAAPEYYLKPFVRQYANLFDFVLSTPVPNSDKDSLWSENICNTKFKRTISFLQNHNFSFSIFLTDHYDDIPLLEIQKSKNILVNPSKYTLEKVKEKNIKFEILK